MDVENALLAKALASGDLATLVARGIETEHFYDDEAQEVYEYSLDFLKEHKQYPSLRAVKDEFPGWRPKLSQEPVSYHLKRFIKHVKENVAVELVRSYHDAIDDPDSILDIEVHALDMARELAEVVPAPTAERLSEGSRRKQEYERRKREGILHGIQLGIPSFDRITYGIQPHELVIWGGPPGGGKTTGIQYTVLSAYLQGKSAYFASLEVEAEQILRRFDTMLSGVRYLALKGLELDPSEEKKWNEILERCESEHLERDIIIRDDIKNCTVAKLDAEQIRYSPDILAVDYLEEMRTPRGMAGWEGVAENGRGLKQTARVTKVPCVTATQLNREGETSYQSAQKIADMLIVLQPDEEDEANNEMELMLRKYRDGPSRRTVMMHWNLERMDIREKDISERFVARERPKPRRNAVLANKAKRRQNGHHADTNLQEILKRRRGK